MCQIDDLQYRTVCFLTDPTKGGERHLVIYSNSDAKYFKQYSQPLLKWNDQYNNIINNNITTHYMSIKM